MGLRAAAPSGRRESCPDPTPSGGRESCPDPTPAGGRESWRYVDCGAVDAFENAAQLPVLIRSMVERNQPLVMTSIWGATHLNVGWFDDVDSTLDLDACRRLGVQVVRRQLYGGGTAFYDKGCSVMWTFLVPREGHGDLDGELARFQPVVLGVLSRLGLGEVGFEGSSDLRVNGRKLGALAAQDVMVCMSIGGFLNVAPPDVDLYLQVARVPDEKFKDKVVKDLREYLFTAEQVRGRPLGYEEFREAFRAALVEAGIDAVEEPLGEEERRGVAKIASKLSGEDRVRRVSSERFVAAAPPESLVGFANFKGRKLCRAGVAIDPAGMIVKAMLAGDMHVSPPDVIDRAAAALVGARVGRPVLPDSRPGRITVEGPRVEASERILGGLPPEVVEDLRCRLAGVFEAPDVNQAEVAMGITTADLLAAVVGAVLAAAGASND